MAFDLPTWMIKDDNKNQNKSFLEPDPINRTNQTDFLIELIELDPT